MASSVGLWARLTNARRSIHLASGDWERILFRHGSLASTSEERCSEDDQTWLWTAEEARALSDALVAGGGRQCIGSLMIDLAFGEHASGTGHILLADDLTPERRTEKVILFLREGSFRWRFVTGPRQVFSGGSAR